MFPIADVHGNIVGFTGRILTDEKKEAKYVNTPETSLYKKSAVLYGLEKAKGEIRQRDQAVLVEGNMDVIASHQFSVTNVVASSGTALTSEQLALLKRFTTNLAIAFDQDAAGQTATLRGLDVARLQDFSIKIISLPPDAGKDADEAIRKDPAIWKQAIQNAVSVMEWVYRSGFKNKQPERPEDKKDIADFILPKILRIADALEQDHWLRKLAKDLDTSIEVLKAKKLPKPSPSLGAAKGKAGVGTNPDQNMTGQAAAEALTAEHYLFALIISQKMLPAFVIEELKLKPEEWEHETIRSLYKALFFGYDPNIQSMSQPHITGVDINRPPATLEADQTNLLNILAFLAERDFKAWSLDQGKKEIQTRVSVMRDVRRQTERRRLENEMRQAERTGDTAKITEIMQQFQALRES
jgi:DNA primase